MIIIKEVIVKREISAGGVVYRRQVTSNKQQEILWLVGKHSGYKKWVLPKGLIREGETAKAAAVREVAEETGITARIIEKLQPAEKYTYTLKGVRVFKVVQYFLMEYVAGDIKDHDWEMEEVEWLPFEEAYKRLEFGGQKWVLKQAQEMVASDGDPPMEAGKINMYYVYVLKSLKDGKLYTGKTHDLRKRVKRHMEGGVLATKGRRPLVLVYYEGFANKTDCGREELFLKSGIGRESLKHRLVNSV